MADENPITPWIAETIHGPMGMQAWLEEQEIEDHEVTPEMVARWIIGALADPTDIGSREVISKIIETRIRKAKQRQPVTA